MNTIQGLPPLNAMANGPSTAKAQEGRSFKATLANYMNQMKDLQQRADNSVDRLIAGDNVDIHQVMIAVEEASISFQLLLEMRNKLLEAYQEMMRMRI